MEQEILKVDIGHVSELPKRYTGGNLEKAWRSGYGSGHTDASASTIPDKDYILFVNTHHPKIRMQYRIAKMTKEELLGKTVVSIVSGYSGNAGTRMIISHIKDNGSIGLVPADKESATKRGLGSDWQNKVGWICTMWKLPFEVSLED